jgi:hypothetical protein
VIDDTGRNETDRIIISKSQPKRLGFSFSVYLLLSYPILSDFDFRFVYVASIASFLI